MTGATRTVSTVLVVALIAGAIVFLESKKGGSAIIATDTADVTIATSTESERASTTTSAIDSATRIAVKKKEFDVAKEIVKPFGFVNTDPFAIQSFVGKKVILVDFWTYSCINCIRTLPYVTAWYQKYKDEGLVVVGVHTPEFDFEKVLANVEMAVKKFGITYPVVLDNDYGTWGAYGNQYWPHEYLIDIDGFIAEDHIGEGGYADTEREIQKLLSERNQVLGLSTTISTGLVDPNAVLVDTSMPLSPETYFGSKRNEYFANGTPGLTGSKNYILQATGAKINEFSLANTWSIQPEYAQTSQAGAEIFYKYQAHNVYFVAAAPHTQAIVEVDIDGVPIHDSMRGDDVDENGLLHIDQNRLYSIVKDSAWGTHSVELILKSGTLQAFTFTFG